MATKKAQRIQEAVNYGGADSGCAQATKKLGYPSSCLNCPFEQCVIDVRDHSGLQRAFDIPCYNFND